MNSLLCFRSLGRRNCWIGKKLPSTGESGGDKKPLEIRSSLSISVVRAASWEFSQSDSGVDVSEVVDDALVRSPCLTESTGSSFNDRICEMS